LSNRVRIATLKLSDRILPASGAKMRAQGFVTAAVLAFGGAVAAQDAPRCTGAGGGHLGAAGVCSTAAPVLSGRAEALVLEILRDEAQVLAGRLVWRSGGQDRRGPVVEVTATDRALDPRAGARLARGLLAVTDLP